jgi:hypothetical protein
MEDKQKISPRQLIDFVDAAIAQAAVHFTCQFVDKAAIHAHYDHHNHYITLHLWTKKFYYLRFLWYHR